MSDFNQLEMSRGTIFKDAVLSLAEATSMEIIAEAGKKRAAELEQVYSQAESSDYEVVKSKFFQESNREFTAVASQARQELLHHREELVAGLFAEVEKRLAEFAAGDKYAPWMAGQLKQHTDMAKDGKALTVYLRPADMGQKDALAGALPGAAFAEDATILLGGVKVSDGHILYDETLDEKLQAEKQAFYESGEMRL